MSSITDLLTDSTEHLQPALGAFTMGIVSENSNSEHPGMVRVEFATWEQGKNISDWVPVLQSYAGKSYGAHLLPEVGDKVLLGFLGGDYREPFVMGSFFPAGAGFPKDSFKDKNESKLFATKGGVRVCLSDEADKQALSVTTPKGLTLTVSDDGGRIELTDEKAENKLLLDAQGGKLELTAKNNIVLSSGSVTVELDGQSGKCAVSCGQLELSASQTGKLSGGQMLTLEGGVLKAEGKQVASLKAATMLELSGMPLKLN